MFKEINRIGVKWFIMLTSSVVARGFEPRLGQTKDYKHVALRNKSKDWLNHDNVPSGATCLTADCCFSELPL
jgi:hypothetical protein